MKIIVFVVVLAILFPEFSFSQVGPRQDMLVPWTNPGIKKAKKLKIKKLKIYSISADDKTLLENNVNESDEFDKNGKLIKVRRDLNELDDNNTEKFSISIYNYNSDGTLDYIQTDSVDLFPVAHSFQYESGRVVFSRIASADARLYLYEYNKKGLLHFRYGKTASALDENNQPKWEPIDTLVYSYSKDGKLEKINYFYPGISFKCITYSYNKEGYPTVITYLNEDLKPFTIETYKYDKNGLVDEMVFEDTFLKEKTIYKYVYEYF
jgi:hypothetical protein